MKHRRLDKPLIFSKVKVMQTEQEENNTKLTNILNNSQIMQNDILKIQNNIYNQLNTPPKKVLKKENKELYSSNSSKLLNINSFKSLKDKKDKKSMKDKKDKKDTTINKLNQFKSVVNNNLQAKAITNFNNEENENITKQIVNNNGNDIESTRKYVEVKLNTLSLAPRNWARFLLKINVGTNSTIPTTSKTIRTPLAVSLAFFESSLPINSPTYAPSPPIKSAETA